MSKLFEQLKTYADSDYLPMHMPGHKRRMGDLGNPFFIDITEIGGFDNLHHAEGILLDAQRRAADLYHSEETHYLINGSTAGILSAISGCVSFGGKILLARNSHKSAYHAVMLKGLQAEYLYPQSLNEMGINGPISPEDVENILKKDSDIQAVMITSPTYDGIVSDVRTIAEIVHGYGLPLIVDEAHGAHFPFSRHFPEDSISCGADVVIHSLHKTLPTLTQTAVLHLNGSLVNRERIRKYLTIYQSSSPSYVLMASIDQCVEWIASHTSAFEQFYKDLIQCREKLRELKILKLLEASGMDESKILISVMNAQISGHELDQILREKYHIELEMACSSYVCAITSIGDTKESLNRLTEALQEIDKSLQRVSGAIFWGDGVIRTESVCTIQQAEEAEKEQCLLENADGKISGDFVTLYPPGIPILAPGEKVSVAIVERLKRYTEEGFEVHGIRNGSLLVLKREYYG
ncbi:MAG: aminotransferase class V-fold PLP-dependent enzyme [Lachnospiraceae bacterium]|nr:aminotransferase class V-fold PLP-dependent enzyme [Lachnospiraceae bacterium]